MLLKICDKLIYSIINPNYEVKLTICYAARCPSLTDPNNGTLKCLLGDDEVPSYEDTCNFTCNNSYELTGSETRTCQTDGNWSGNETNCRKSKQSVFV